MAKKEPALVTAIKSLLAEDLKNPLGEITKLGQKSTELGHRELGTQYLRERVNQRFAEKVADSPYRDNLTQAFGKTHLIHDLATPEFHGFLAHELAAQGIPVSEIKLAQEATSELADWIKNEHDVWAERDFGLTTRLGEIRDLLDGD